MRQVPDRELWLGNMGDLRDPHSILSADIKAIVELADNEQFTALPRELIRCRFPLSDGGDNSLWLLRMAVESVAALLRAKISVLVNCSAGMSRSICVAAGAVALAEGRTMADSLAEVAKLGPADVSPRFLAQVQRALNTDE